MSNELKDWLAGALILGALVAVVLLTSPDASETRQMIKEQKEANLRALDADARALAERLGGQVVPMESVGAKP